MHPPAYRTMVPAGQADIPPPPESPAQDQRDACRQLVGEREKRRDSLT